MNKKQASWRFMAPAGLVLLLLLSLLAGASQPAQARPLPQSDSSVTLPMTVIINEVGWSGTSSNPDDQWVELYNPGSTAIPLNHWQLQFTDSVLNVNHTIDITTDKEIAPGGYFLLEWYEDFFGVGDRLFFPTAYALPQSGAELRLYSGAVDTFGRLEDTANLGGGIWPAGSGRTGDGSFCSMERAGVVPDSPQAWVTYRGSGTDITIPGTVTPANSLHICGSPGQSNWALTVTLTPSPTITDTPTITPTRTITPTGTITPTRTLTPTAAPTRTPKKSPTPTHDPSILPPSSVFINEFLTQPRFDWNGDGKVDTGDEFIELTNLSDQPVSLAGWSLDDQPGDSSPYSIRNVTIQPRAYVVFFTSQTKILLSSGGDTVRLFKPGNKISDAFSYTFSSVPDQSWCRYPDSGSNWVFGCEPTPGQANLLGPVPLIGKSQESTACTAQKLPPAVLLAECEAAGISAWNSDLWAGEPGYPRYYYDDKNVYIFE